MSINSSSIQSYVEHLEFDLHNCMFSDEREQVQATLDKINSGQAPHQLNVEGKYLSMPTSQALFEHGVVYSDDLLNLTDAQVEAITEECQVEVKAAIDYYHAIRKYNEHGNQHGFGKVWNEVVFPASDKLSKATRAMIPPMTEDVKRANEGFEMRAFMDMDWEERVEELQPLAPADRKTKMQRIVKNLQRYNEDYSVEELEDFHSFVFWLTTNP